MKYCQYNEALVAFTEVDAIREASSDGFAHVAVQHRELLGCAGDALDQELDFGKEFHSESVAFFFIPVARLIKLRPRLPAEDDWSHYRCQRA